MSQKMALLFLLLFTGCSSLNFLKQLQSKDLILPDHFEFNPPEYLSALQLNSDVNILLYAFQNAYGGRKYVEQESFKNALLKLDQLNRGDLKTPPRFCEQLSIIFNEVLDNHLAAKFDGKDCNTQKNIFYSQTPVGKNVLQDKDSNWKITYQVIYKKKIPIVAITSFPKYEDNAWKGFLENIFKIKKENNEAMIIDLRQNEGGDDTMGIQMASIFYGQDVPDQTDVIIKSQTPETFALLINNYKIKKIRSEKRNKTVPEYIMKRLELAQLRYLDALNGKFNAEEYINGGEGNKYNSKKSFDKSIYVLVDRGCASSCEGTVDALMAHPKVITIGENTGGFIHFGNMGNLVLPNSKIVIQMATDFWKRKDGQYIEKIGISPIIKTNNKDALEVAIEKIKLNLKK